MAHLRTVKVATDEDLSAQIGQGDWHFDLVDFDRVRSFEVMTNRTLSSFKEELACELGVRVEFQRLWFWAKRMNSTFRPVRPVTPEEEARHIGKLEVEKGELKVFLEVEHGPLLELQRRPPQLTTGDILLFLKLYDPEKEQLRYVGRLFVNDSEMPSDILPKLNRMAGFPEDEDIELYEEIRPEPLMCEQIDKNLSFQASQLENGDIICYQKMPKPGESRKCPNVKSFFLHIRNEKNIDTVRNGIHSIITRRGRTIAELREANDVKLALEQFLAFTCQATRDMEDNLAAARNDLDSRNAECVQLKYERDNAVREVDELRKQMTYKFSLLDLEQATQNFSEALKIGEGRYGRIYRGTLHSTTVVVKMSSSHSLFQQEISILSQVRHPNIVTFIGACSEASAFFYEYFPNGNLEDRLSCAENSAPLPWHVRTRIIGEICCALTYLQSHKPNALVHGDIRPENILLDANLKSKLSNFDKSNPLLQLSSDLPNMMGTLAYMDPEFLTTGELTPLSDIYSFGIVILRLLTGRPPFAIAKEVSEALENGKLQSIFDATAGDWPYLHGKQLARLGLACVQATGKNRPDLVSEVYTLLQPSVKESLLSVLRPFRSSFGESCAPFHFMCPITKEVMDDPQVASDGFTYEAEAIKRWLNSGNRTSPMTNLTLPSSHLIPNLALRSAIQDYLQQQQQQQQQRESPSSSMP